MEGDVRIHGKSATIYVVASSTYRPENSTIKIRPYVQKWERGTMSKIQVMSIRSTSPAAAGDDIIVPPRCTVRHDVPVVVFSTDTYRTNYFHAMSDIIVPLYTTAHEFDGNVQLLIAGYDLCLYPVIDLDAAAAVRCFLATAIGLEGHKILGIDPSLSRNGYTMMGFCDFLRSTFSLPRPWSTPIGQKKPRLVMVLRRHSRALTNEADAVAAMAGLRFDVVAAAPEEVRDMDRFASVMNSCDVMVGVHGAGLTNMVFLPHKQTRLRDATLVQIIPWGAMKWAFWYDFGQPAPGMGLRYVETR
ncbi:hypothetical protein QOZ80_3BG0273140 [Eleusine coracana subsp. coracana]|nr:hypothetical protein QOZ80_3BG0273140 [Eleusine coracana subsp. coracana]